MLRKLTLLVLIAALAVVAFVNGSGNTRAQEPLKIGLMSDQTGALKQYGKELEQGFMLGLKYATEGTMEVAGRPLEVLVRDNAGKPDVGASQAREVIEKDGAEILVGAPSSGVACNYSKSPPIWALSCWPARRPRPRSPARIFTRTLSALAATPRKTS